MPQQQDPSEDAVRAGSWDDLLEANCTPASAPQTWGTSSSSGSIQCSEDDEWEDEEGKAGAISSSTPKSFSSMMTPLPLFSERCPEMAIKMGFDQERTALFSREAERIDSQSLLQGDADEALPKMTLLEKPFHTTTCPEFEPHYKPSPLQTEQLQVQHDQAFSDNPSMAVAVYDNSKQCKLSNLSQELDGLGTLLFESRIESGNLARAARVGPSEYNLLLSFDVNTRGHTQWFYYRVTAMERNVPYRFNILNLQKNHSLYEDGLQPIIYSKKKAEEEGIGWHRAGYRIVYGSNKVKRKKGTYRSLTFTLEFPYDDDTVYIAHCYPYRFSDLQVDIEDWENRPGARSFLKKRTLCKTIGGHDVTVLTITARSDDPEEVAKRPAILFTGRVHPGETNASWMMQGTVDFLTSQDPKAVMLRNHYVFKIVPMLNPDGVVVGNYRSNLSGHDLNRRYGNPDPNRHIEVFSLKEMVQSLVSTRPVELYVDYHGHSNKWGLFMYGCEKKFWNTARDGETQQQSCQEKVIPWLLHEHADAFNFQACSFHVRKSKENSGRVVMWRGMGICNAYTMEASFGGCSKGPLGGLHMSIKHLRQMGQDVCSALTIVTTQREEVQSILHQLQQAYDPPSEEDESGGADKDHSIVDEIRILQEQSAGSGGDSSSSDDDIPPPKIEKPPPEKRDKKKKNKSSKKSLQRSRSDSNIQAAAGDGKSSPLQARVSSLRKMAKNRNSRTQSPSTPNSKKAEALRMADRLRKETAKNDITENLVKLHTTILRPLEDLPSPTSERNKGAARSSTNAASVVNSEGPESQLRRPPVSSRARAAIGKALRRTESVPLERRIERDKRLALAPTLKPRTDPVPTATVTGMLGILVAKVRRDRQEADQQAVQQRRQAQAALQPSTGFQSQRSTSSVSIGRGWRAGLNVVQQNGTAQHTLR